MNNQTVSKEVTLEADYIKEITDAAKMKFPEIKRIIVFGSRALKTSKPGSDIDLAIEGENVTRAVKLNFYDWLNHESNIPYKLDVIDMQSVVNKELLTHIHENGKVIYKV